ncbi:MAG: hypothetical protein GY768_12835 [Planctomycetaceae bacterium]|nr:hypothetical protein [Planctomycetaceae bacterium]
MKSATTSAKSTLQRVFAFFAILLLMVFVFVFLTITFGQVSGSEFAPDGFRRRTFIFYQIPLLKLQITPVFRNDSSNDLENYLRTKNIVKAPKKVGRWDSVQVSTGSNISDGDAFILCNYLDATNLARDLIWLEWTKSADNHKKFKPFWAAVQRAAEVEAYFVIPDLFETASDSSNSDPFEATLNSCLVESFTTAGDDHFSIGDYQRADELYSAAAKLDPENKKLIEKQSEAEQRIQETTAATAINE